MGFFWLDVLFLDCSYLDIGLASQSHQAGCFDITGFEDHGSFCSDFLHRFQAGIFCCCCIVSFCRLYFGLAVLIFFFVIFLCCALPWSVGCLQIYHLQLLVYLIALSSCSCSSFGD